LFNRLDWVPNLGACIDSCLSGDVTRGFRLYNIKLGLSKYIIWLMKKSPQ